MAVLFVFTSCEKEDPVIEKPKEVELLPDFSTLSKQEVADWYKNLDRSKLERNFYEIKAPRKDRSTRIELRDQCGLELEVERTQGTATEYEFFIFETGEVLPIYYGTIDESTPTVISPPAYDDTKSYDVYVQPEDGGSTEEFWVRLRTPDDQFNFTMATWDSERTAYWLEMDNSYLACSD
ncbi:hypothetical protein [Membranihabitans maritimus]|uniref:hypothetical protein n=1 Tax=Membranihabitans maritimus TaxID=2904244 RepID=UPI001F43EEB1|nr:hypothetical protein [Membranihabitans maritimus]